MASKLYREAELVANDKKTNSLLINKKQNDDQSDYFFEEHVRQEKAKCFFCYSTVNLNPDFKKRLTKSSSIDKSGQKYSIL